MPKFFPQFLITGIVLLLLLGAGYGIATIQAARAIPWDCSDWQAFSHDDRTTAILESLAENRGKTLYCGVDQSDTFTKSETWEAGRDRNERDDTVYFGERGQFRGFIAAQEGYLTDGESGVTGVSIDRIFEFPREPKKRRRKKPLPRPNLVYGGQYNADNVHYSGSGGLNGHPYYCAGGDILNPNVDPGTAGTRLQWRNGYVTAQGPAGAELADSTAAQESAKAAFEQGVTRSQLKAWARDGGPLTSKGPCEAATGATGECQSLRDENGEQLYTGTPRIIQVWLDDNYSYGGNPPKVTPTNYRYNANRVLYYTAYFR